MKLLNFGSFSLLSAFVALVACSSSDATTGGGVATSGASCQLAKVAGCDAAVSCSKQHCGSEVISCFGQDLKSGSCSSFVTCIDACTCTDTNCIATCEASAITDPNCGPCLSATGALRTCTTASNCDAACGAAGAGGGAGAGSAGYAGTVGTAGAGTAGAGTTAGFGGDLGTAGAGTAGLGGGTAGAGGGAGWYCTQSGTDCVCVTGVGVSADTCTSRPPCCIHFTTGGTEGCECVDLTGTGVMCSALATQLTGTVESTCPPP